MASVAVVGAGIVGSSTADLLRKQLSDKTQVTLIASKFAEDTTSYGAAGVFRMNECDYIPENKLDQWLRLSFEHYHKLARSDLAPKVGAHVLKLYQIFNEPHFNRPLYTKFCYDYRQISSQELQHMQLPTYCRSGFLVSTVMIEPRHYMPHLLQTFRNRGGTIVHQSVSSWSDLKNEFDLIINCTGAGSRQLCNDHRMYPIRGQVVRARAPWLRHGFNLNKPDTYIYPGLDQVTLGGIREVDSWSDEISQSDTEKIIQRCKALEPSLCHAQVEEIWAGVRPCRDQIRVEADLDSYAVPVIHNYGHGGHGVMLAYGTAVEAVELTKKFLKMMKHKL